MATDRVDQGTTTLAGLGFGCSFGECGVAVASEAPRYVRSRTLVPQKSCRIGAFIYRPVNRLIPRGGAP